MRKNNQQKPLARWIAASLAAGAMAGFGAQAVAATAAGTIIKNLATVTYEDANGNKYSAQSNEAFVTVAEVYSATVENDKALAAAPGQTVYFPHVLTNTGNSADTYTINTDTVVAGVVVYNDLNSNGQPDPGEPSIPAGGTITIPAGEQVNLVVAMPIPVTAVSGDVLTADLDVTTANGDVVDVTTPTDATGTVTDSATVTTDPVLVLGKQSVHNPATNEITYTLTVKNNGGSAATNVNILDALPTVDTDGAGTLAQMTFVQVDETNGLVNTGDSVGTHDAAYDEAGTDLNDNGVATDTLAAIVATDVSLPPNTTVSVTYTVKYTAGWVAGADIDNTFVATHDNPDTTPGAPATLEVSSNTTHDVLPQYYAVDANDDGRGTGTASTGIDANNGVDDSVATTDDTQYVASVPTGAEVLYTHVISNEGNGDDVFNLEVTNTDFPSGTVFTFWDATGTVQVTDTDNDGIPDTGVLAIGGKETILIKAKLPSGVADADPVTPPAGGYNAILTATSANEGKDAIAADDNDVTNLKLGSITAAAVDIANTVADQGADLAAGFNDDGSVNAQEDGPAVIADAVVGGTVVYDLKLANESGSSDSYLLSAENIPAGWSVVYKDKLTGNVITTTPLIPGAEDYEYQAVVTISADPALAKSDSDQKGQVIGDDAVDGYDDINNGSQVLTGGDGDKDYFIDFIAASTGTPGLEDTVRNAIDVAPMREVVITPNGQNQIQPGGTVDYTHLLENNGNLTEKVELAVANSETDSGWTTVINIDTDGDGIPDAASNTLIGQTIQAPNPDGTPTFVDILVTDTDGDGVIELLLPAGVDVAMSTTVNAPSNAPLGTVDLSTITVADATIDTPTGLGATLDTAEDQTNVILGQVRLEKTAAIDEDCDGSLETGFSTNQTTTVEPGDCVTWQLHATNEGNATVSNVVMSDAAPAFTDLIPTYFVGGVPGTVSALKFCHGNGCAPDATTATNATMDVGTGVVQFIPNGGQLVSGETATGQFTVRVQ
ncbi:beta strand repeat-containing protein [Leucothrix mucor]|uniref:beta strand repeat-containing protein n=1 Tax=Leucothrix mucor TaxID=45248 RepID=UPI0003B30500|nr:DUF11 domain-containing protein [Leucothrix mucor]